MLKLFFLLLCGHALADYALQSNEMIHRKDPTRIGVKAHGPWWWTMLAHSLINGGIVTLITGSLFMGITETYIHFSSDTGKCCGYIGVWADQGIHVISKGLYAYLIWRGYV